MPIQLNYTSADTGEIASASYWFIRFALFDFSANQVEIPLYGYWNLAAKNAGKTEMLRKTYVYTFAVLGINGNSTFAQAATAAYNKIIADDTFFAGASIV